MSMILKLVYTLFRLPYISKGVQLLTAPASKTFKSTLAIVLLLLFAVYSSYTNLVETHKNQLLIIENNQVIQKLSESNKKLDKLQADIKKLQEISGQVLNEQLEIKQTYKTKLDKANELLKNNTCANTVLPSELIKLLQQLNSDKSVK